ncbi:hypothetical protein OIN60_09300 [Paenibacillus sp. P96]|uniref:DUF4190 domain-containing protein n=1 Tax=Paenibacillus zeirhizosphaerae TaxID=2987519 RepID=A0ABT9FQS3_9BACL|nr:hypothetical protein [Paenibacillus sp. P96]MDP4096965.1 hypothetical protein [Paenibacillus sp. P96]
MEDNNRFQDKKTADFRSSRTPIVRDRVDYPRKEHREEYAAEVAPGRPVEGRAEVTESGKKGKTAGYTGIVLGILAMFIWSIVLGPIAAVLGIYAFMNGKKTLGGWAIGLGVLATVSYFAFIPFVR